MMGTIQQISDQDFEAEVLKANGLVVVDFWAEWCGPCKAMSPIVDDVAGEMAGRVKMVKMNVDESPHTPGKFNIRGIPTLIAFKDGKQVATKVGGMSKSQLTEWLSSVA
jgi:thioredoxin 1